MSRTAEGRNLVSRLNLVAVVDVAVEFQIRGQSRNGQFRDLDTANDARRAADKRCRSRGGNRDDRLGCAIDRIIERWAAGVFGQRHRQQFQTVGLGGVVKFSPREEIALDSPPNLIADLVEANLFFIISTSGVSRILERPMEKLFRTRPDGASVFRVAADRDDQIKILIDERIR